MQIEGTSRRRCRQETTLPEDFPDLKVVPFLPDVTVPILPDVKVTILVELTG